MDLFITFFHVHTKKKLYLNPLQDKIFTLINVSSNKWIFLHHLLIGNYWLEDKKHIVTHTSSFETFKLINYINIIKMFNMIISYKHCTYYAFKREKIKIYFNSISQNKIIYVFWPTMAMMYDKSHYIHIIQ
jgi:hypothetical protein